MALAPIDLAYGAGVVDSDGWIGIRRSKPGKWQSVYAPRIVVKQVERQAVDLLRDMFGGNLHTQPGTSTRRAIHAWDCHSASAAAACEALLPYLRIKREQAENAIAVGRLNTSGTRRRFQIPDVIPGEPLLPLLDAARLAGRSPAVAYQSASIGNIPCIRDGRRVLVPESFVDTWRDRPASASRRPELTAQLEAHYQRGRELNRVGPR